MKKALMIFLIIIFVLAVYFLLALSPVLYSGKDKLEKEESIVLTGHRGAAGLAPENTLAAIQKGLDNNVDRIEIDVQQTKDNVVISLHDITINRTTNGVGLVKNMTYNEILKFSAGIKFSEKFKDEKVPTLNDVLKLVNGQAVLVIEIKAGNDYYPGIEQRVVDAINEHNAKQWVIVHSFNDSALEKIREIDETIELHKLFIADFPFIPLIYDGKFRITNLKDYRYATEISTFYTFTTQRLVDQVHAMNKKINVWTVNDSIKINRLINMGVDGIITDYPNYFGR
ncbi:MAG: glycerophosphodiester phosphodiesterase family protein [Bacteroidota bacterium]